MKKSFFFTLLSIILIITGFSEDFSVSYINGEVFLLLRGKEEYLYIGDLLSVKDRIRIEEGGILEIQGDSRNFTLAGPGTFDISSMLTLAGNRESVPLGRLLGRRIERLISSSDLVNPSSVMGVRGAAVDDAEIDWIGSESDLYISRGREEIKQRDYFAAQQSFSRGLETAREFGETESEAELSFLLSYTQSINGESGPALYTLSSLQADPYAPWYPEYRLHHARLLLESGAAEKAVEIMRQNREIHPLQNEDELILGIALLEIGGTENKEARSILSRLASGSGPAAEIARSYLQK